MKPILFKTEMVKAIQDGRKTTTRRVLKPKYKDDEYGFEILTNRHTGQLLRVEKTDESGDTFDDMRVISPPYQLGDILYVRETWGWNYCYDCGMADGGLDIVDFNDGHIESEPFRCNDETAERIFLKKEQEYGCYCYKASAEDGEIPDGDGRWHPSIHMPKEATRLFLRVTSIRVERLQDITPKQAIKEGAKDPYDYQEPAWYDQFPHLLDKYEIAAFAGLWDTTIPKKDLARYGWNANPWVWVIEFERISKEEALKNGV